jgi:hypothetical protein
MFLVRLLAGGRTRKSFCGGGEAAPPPHQLHTIKADLM